jgi:hypothetical protein
VKVGTLVQRDHDTGAMGSVPIFGVVTQETPKTFVVTWERNHTSRVRKAQPNGVEAVKPFNLDVAREVLASKGVALP